MTVVYSQAPQASDAGSLTDKTSLVGVAWTRWIIWIVVSISTALRLSVAVLPEHILTKLVIDDAAYYARISQHVVEGHGSTFDGISATNGYHPLWMLISASSQTISGGGFAQFRMLAVIQALTMLAAMGVFVHVFRPRLGDIPVAIGLALWTLTPMSLVGSMSGVEGALAALTVMGVIWAGINYLDAPSSRHAIVAGLTIGVTFLARTDSLFAVVGVGLWIVIEQRRTCSNKAILARHSAMAMAASLVVASPWLIWNLMSFGTIEQSSTGARPMVVWNHLERTGGTGTDTVSHLLTVTIASAKFLGTRWSGLLGWPPVLAIGGILLSIWVIRNRTSDQRANSFTRLGLALLLAGSALAVVHAGIRMVPREYYFEWVRMGLGVFAAGITARSLRQDSEPANNRSTSTHRFGHVLLCGAIGLSIFQSIQTVQTMAAPPFEWQPSMVEAGRWLEANTEPSDRVLSFNAGFISYFSQRTVLNLDGVVNNQALDALKERRLASYMCESEAKWYVDFEPWMLEEHSDFLGPDSDRLMLEPVVEFHSQGSARYDNGSTMQVFRFSCTD
ncbi:MAG: glycosyltransferase family 39 protein [Microthrixaceae bacterium]|nr:glycosyltransferase family 39 protein [Microthrixaceae bacterium]